MAHPVIKKVQNSLMWISVQMSDLKSDDAYLKLEQKTATTTTRRQTNKQINKQTKTKQNKTTSSLEQIVTLLPCLLSIQVRISENVFLVCNTYAYLLLVLSQPFVKGYAVR